MSPSAASTLLVQTPTRLRTQLRAYIDSRSGPSARSGHPGLRPRVRWPCGRLPETWAEGSASMSPSNRRSVARSALRSYVTRQSPQGRRGAGGAGGVGAPAGAGRLRRGIEPPPRHAGWDQHRPGAGGCGGIHRGADRHGRHGERGEPPRARRTGRFGAGLPRHLPARPGTVRRRLGRLSWKSVRRHPPLRLHVASTGATFIALTTQLAFITAGRQLAELTSRGLRTAPSRRCDGPLQPDPRPSPRAGGTCGRGNSRQRPRPPDRWTRRSSGRSTGRPIPGRGGCRHHRDGFGNRSRTHHERNSLP